MQWRSGNVAGKERKGATKEEKEGGRGEEGRKRGKKDHDQNS